MSTDRGWRGYAPRMVEDLTGPPRRRSGEGFAVRQGMWRLALRLALERRSVPGQTGPLVGRWYETAHGRLFARVAAGGGSSASAPVLLVHGVIVSSRYLVPLAVELSRRFPVVVPDLPGSGLSERPASPPTLAGLADAAMACARAAGHDRVALVGNSFGAQVAVEAAIRHPARVERLVLLDPTTDPAARELTRQYVRWQRNAPDEHLSVVPVMARDVVDAGPRHAAHLLRLMLSDRIDAKLPLVRAPTLVVRGGRDRVVPAGWARAAAALLPHGRLTVLPGYAHMPHWSGPLALAPVLGDFLAGATSP